MRRATAVCIAGLGLLLAGPASATDTPTLGDRGCDYPASPPTWAQQPSETEIRKAYPTGAPPTGSTEMVCIIGVDGRMRDCRITRQSPAGAGFGAASLKLAAAFRMTPPHCADGRPAEGGEVAIPMQWKYW